MPKLTDISSSQTITLEKPLPGGEGLGWGSEAVRPRVGAGVEPPSPTLPQWVRGLRRGFGGVVFPPVVAVGVEGQFFGDALDNTIGVLQDVVVPEADHAVAVALDHPGSRFVGRAVGMLPAVHFDYQLKTAASEIGDSPADLEFAGELNAQLLGAQPRPQAYCSIGRLAPQLLRNWCQALSSQSRIPSKLPFPWGRGWGWGLKVSITRRTPIPTLPHWGRAFVAKTC